MLKLAEKNAFGEKFEILNQINDLTSLSLKDVRQEKARSKAGFRD